jgi:HAMP domain-containing protein
LHIYRKFLKDLIRNYLFGSAVAVLGVGGIFIFSTLDLSPVEMIRMCGVLAISLLIMLGAELIMFNRHIRPIKQLFRQAQPSPETLRIVYFRTHRFPALSVKRTLGPHLLGLTLPAVTMMFFAIKNGLISLPYSYIGMGALGAFLVASMHGLIEFFLTHQTIRPVLNHIRELSLELHQTDISLDGQVLVSLQRKFQLSAFLIGTFPLFLFSLAAQIRLTNVSLQSTMEYWKWAAIILIIGIAFSSFGAWLLSRDIQQPIRHLFESMGMVRNGDFDTQAADIYSDEFSKLVAGFNHMVAGLKSRENMNNQLLQSYFTTLAAALDARDPYTAGHSERVTEFSVVLGKLIRLPESELENLRKAALLHDIGKIGVRDDVLLKEGRLTDEEFAAIKLHPVLGESILKQIEPAEAMEAILPGVRSHHEQYDGSGYPDNLSGERIPLMGRIIAVADAYDAITSDRPYRKGMPVDKALRILEEGTGKQWDPVLTPLFIQYIREKIEGKRNEN